MPHTPAFLLKMGKLGFAAAPPGGREGFCRAAEACRPGRRAALEVFLRQTRVRQCDRVARLAARQPGGRERVATSHEARFGRRSPATLRGGADGCRGPLTECREIALSGVAPGKGAVAPRLTGRVRCRRSPPCVVPQGRPRVVGALGRKRVVIHSFNRNLCTPAASAGCEVCCSWGGSRRAPARLTHVQGACILRHPCAGHAARRPVAVFTSRLWKGFCGAER